MKKIVLCPPDYYDIEYEINPWMSLGNKVDKLKVQGQYQALRQLYLRLDVQTLEIKPDPGLPDMVYTINTGWVAKGIFIKANFRYPQRRREADLMGEFLEEELNLETKTLPTGVYFEGGGDLLKAGEKYFLGWGKRSVYEAKNYLEEFLESKIIDINLENPYFYHLDTCFAPLCEDTVVINEGAFKPEELKKIQQNFKNIIVTNEQDNKFLACNIVVFEKNIIITKGISLGLRQRIESFGFQVHEVGMSEYLKGGGSVKCVSLGIED
ncbi:MAG: arginine deiminase family protein [Patescibacteria group bacterium]|nr:arginine deiminase family protein [Patescibacteria group bacterium]